MKLDARVLLRTARDFAGLGQGELAVRGGVARSTVNAYEAGRRSPTLMQLNALLAACGMRARVELIGLGPEMDARIDAALAAVPTFDASRLAQYADSFDEADVRWALDGSTALALQGLAIGEALAFAVVLDDAFRRYVYKRNVKAYDAWNQLVRVPMGNSRQDMQVAFDRGEALVWGIGFVMLRVVDELPSGMLRVTLDDGRVVSVLAVADVLEAQPDWADVVRGVLQRRAETPG